MGISISLFLLWRITLAVVRQWKEMENPQSWADGPIWMIMASLALMPMNLGLEIIKWRWLCRFAHPLTWKQTVLSFFAGISLSFITPNRIGEYPGRLLYLRQKNTIRLISVSLLGILSQMISLFFFGALGLIYAQWRFAGIFPRISLFLCLGAILLLGVIYIFYDFWYPFLGKIRWFRKWKVFGRLMVGIPRKHQAGILGISGIKTLVYTAQYLILLDWAGVVPLGVESFFLSGLFFWTNAMIPGWFLLELGQRSQIGVFIFSLVSENTLGIVAATVGLWLINLVIPSLVGSLIILRMKWIR